jgi:hypothetical protein
MKEGTGKKELSRGEVQSLLESLGVVHAGIFFFFLRQCHYVKQAQLELYVAHAGLPQPPKDWDYRCVPPCPTLGNLLSGLNQDSLHLLGSYSIQVEWSAQILDHFCNSKLRHEAYMSTHEKEKKKENKKNPCFSCLFPFLLS